ncbi:hypothetical protein GLOTRDRAFT_71188 [Gloeophyllum trabeum ATCC 11539]|uniref:Uncharacterized protein n=1 Tax=Gloeophyllum trabeum (strain ATCC 11539 / FP-39264 / Madison 617) TaxID=670483 RepID=S7QIY7_GLOTA|nr:uncharacterized protein GLOTRDRAFT_71188 [Gloeophyllum trabeum ATCC 11539]EPQ59606.1 hypothetical protein GLOTRDRAFT_71188 [Gloeophyllum trabeum ATCC 11539]
MAGAPIGNVAKALQDLIGKTPSVLSTRPGNLYQVLSRAPDGGVGRKVHQQRWSMKGIQGSYWEVTKTQFKDEGRHGKAWGVFYWKGRQITPAPTRITGALKYSWKEGMSHPNLAPAQPKPKPIQSLPEAAPY